MEDNRKTVETFYCDNCKMLTPHKEDIVFDGQSATVWHCIICGHEKRPKGGNAPVPAQEMSKASLQPVCDV